MPRLRVVWRFAAIALTAGMVAGFTTCHAKRRPEIIGHFPWTRTDDEADVLLTGPHRDGKLSAQEHARADAALKSFETMAVHVDRVVEIYAPFRSDVAVDWKPKLPHVPPPAEAILDARLGIPGVPQDAGDVPDDQPPDENVPAMMNPGDRGPGLVAAANGHGRVQTPQEHIVEGEAGNDGVSSAGPENVRNEGSPATVSDDVPAPKASDGLVPDATPPADAAQVGAGTENRQSDSEDDHAQEHEEMLDPQHGRPAEDEARDDPVALVNAPALGKGLDREIPTDRPGEQHRSEGGVQIGQGGAPGPGTDGDLEEDIPPVATESLAPESIDSEGIDSKLALSFPLTGSSQSLPVTGETVLAPYAVASPPDLGGAVGVTSEPVDPFPDPDHQLLFIIDPSSAPSDQGALDPEDDGGDTGSAPPDSIVPPGSGPVPSTASGANSASPEQRSSPHPVPDSGDGHAQELEEVLDSQQGRPAEDEARDDPVVLDNAPGLGNDLDRETPTEANGNGPVEQQDMPPVATESLAPESIDSEGIDSELAPSLPLTGPSRPLPVTAETMPAPSAVASPSAGGAVGVKSEPVDPFPDPDHQRPFIIDPNPAPSDPGALNPEDDGGDGTGSAPPDSVVPPGSGPVPSTTSGANSAQLSSPDPVPDPVVISTNLHGTPQTTNANPRKASHQQRLGNLLGSPATTSTSWPPLHHLNVIDDTRVERYLLHTFPKTRPDPKTTWTVGVFVAGLLCVFVSSYFIAVWIASVPLAISVPLHPAKVAFSDYVY